MFDGFKIETWVILQMIVLITILYTGWYLRKKETGTPGRRRPTNNKEGGARAHKWLSLVKNCEI